MHSKEHSRCNLDKQHRELRCSPDSLDNQDELSPRRRFSDGVERPVADSLALDKVDYLSPRQGYSGQVGHIPAVEMANKPVLEAFGANSFVLQVDNQALAVKEVRLVLAEMGDKAYKRAGTVAHRMDKQAAHLLHARGRKFVD